VVTGEPAPTIHAVEDVPNDQGGKVSVRWAASMYDVELNELITHYSIWRATDPSSQTLVTTPPTVDLVDVTADFEGQAWRTTTVAGQTYYWEWIDNMPAHYFETYAYTAPTLFDSTAADPAIHHFLVSAHTNDPFEFWDSEPESGYSVDNLAPAVPQNFAGQYSGPSVVTLTWSPNSEADVLEYRMYRGEGADFEPGDDNLVGSTPDTVLTGLPFPPVSPWHFKLSAVDVHGNESDTAVLPPFGPVPATLLSLDQNQPNPFNPSTSISFTVPSPMHVSVSVFDASGAFVKNLVSDRMPAGRRSVEWDGTDRRGSRVATGVYFCRLKAGDRMLTRKMVMVK
jgi:hypothetical protein